MTLAGRSGQRWCLEPDVKLDREPDEHHEVWRRGDAPGARSGEFYEHRLCASVGEG